MIEWRDIVIKSVLIIPCQRYGPCKPRQYSNVLREPTRSSSRDNPTRNN